MRVTVIASGYWNPLHVGHLDYLEAAAKLGDKLVVIVNNDKQVVLKNSTRFLNQADRLRIVRALKCVDDVTLSVDEDGSVCKTLRNVVLHGDYGLSFIHHKMTNGGRFVFANGGDRTLENVPEAAVCKELGIEMVYGVGGRKVASSSDMLEKVACGRS